MLSTFRALYFIAFAFVLFACGDTQTDTLKLHGQTMGTSYSIKIVSPAARKKSESIQKDIDALLDEINLAMSTYIDDSELSRLNQNTSPECIVLSETLATVIKEALRVSQLSNGAFDITVGPLVNLWGFGPVENSGDVPSEQQIHSTLKRVGYDKLEFNEEHSCIKKQNPEIYIDLSAIAKGYAVDRVGDYLESKELNHFMIEIGGEILTKGKNAKGQYWRIGIETPEAMSASTSRSIQEVISLKNLGMATSGDYRNFFEKNGQRYSHTINPLTGMPVTHSLASVTVLHHSTMTADALATAINVMGYEQGLELAEKENLATLFINSKNSVLSSQHNAAFADVIVH